MVVGDWHSNVGLDSHFKQVEATPGVFLALKETNLKTFEVYRLFHKFSFHSDSAEDAPTAIERS
jgi:hypothetical protein